MTSCLLFQGGAPLESCQLPFAAVLGCTESGKHECFLSLPFSYTSRLSRTLWIFLWICQIWPPSTWELQKHLQKNVVVSESLCLLQLIQMWLFKAQIMCFFFLFTFFFWNKISFPGFYIKEIKSNFQRFQVNKYIQNWTSFSWLPSRFGAWRGLRN